MGKKYHYTASAITRTTGVAGLLLGIGSTNFFNSSIFPEWGWRIPFLLSMPLAVLTIYYRNFLEETPVFIESQKEAVEFTNIMPFIKKQWKALLLAIMLSGGFGVTYQVAVIFMKQYLPLVMPNSSSIISTFSVLAVLGFGASMPIAGLIADSLSRSVVFKISLVLTLISCATLVIAINQKLLNLALISYLSLAIAISPFNALAHGVIAKAFKANERYRGIGLGHATGSLLMSGTANYICLLFMRNYDFILFPIIYVAFFALIAYISIELFAKRSIFK
ncbi:MAG: hypothetical protein Tsb006_5550 [Rickettsiaceae bacterium]